MSIVQIIIILGLALAIVYCIVKIVKIKPVVGRYHKVYSYEQEKEKRLWFFWILFYLALISLTVWGLGLIQGILLIISIVCLFGEATTTNIGGDA